MALQTYATPTDDLTAWRDATPTPGEIPPYLAAFLQGGVSPTLGVRGCNGRPLVGPGAACRVSRDGLVRVLVPRNPNLSLLAAIEGGSPVAVTFSRPRDHRSIQLKARSAVVAPILPDDGCEAARQSAVLADELIEIGYSREQADSFVAIAADDLVSVEFRPDRLFTQTPGPGAGAELPR
jgi:hypothetical protein